MMVRLKTVKNIGLYSKNFVEKQKYLFVSTKFDKQSKNAH